MKPVHHSAGPRVVFGFLLAGVIATTTAAAATLPAPVRLPWGSSVELRLDDGKARGFIALGLVGSLDPAKLEVQLVDIKCGELRVESWREAFLLDVHPGDQRKSPTLTVELAGLPQVEPGAYDLVVYVTGEGLDKPVELQIKVEVPSATLTARPLVLKQVEGLCTQSLAGGGLILRETGRVSGLTALSVSQLEVTDANKEPVAGRLILGKWTGPSAKGNGRELYQHHAGEAVAPGDESRLSITIPAASTVEIPVRLSAGFPLGTTTGKLELAAPHLVKPVEVAFTVDRRLRPWLLLVPVLIGLIVGYIVRTWMARRIEVGEVRVQAEDLLDRLARESAERPDATFQAEIAILRTALEQALPGPIEPLRTAITDTETKLKSAITALDSRRKKAAERFAKVLQIVSPSTAWSLPAGILATLRGKEVAAEVEDAKDALNAGRVAAATTAMGNAEHLLSSVVPAQVDAWRKDILARLEALDFETDPLLAEARKQTEGERRAVDTALALLRAGGPQAELAGLVSATATAHRALAELADALLRTLHARLDRLLRALGSLRLPLPDRLDDLRHQSSAFFSEAGEREGPVAALRFVIDHGPKLSGIVESTILDQLEGEKQAAAAELLAAGSYATLEARLEQWLAAPIVVAGEGQGLRERKVVHAGAAVGSGLEPLALLLGGADDGAGQAAVIIARDGAATAVAARRARTFGELAGLKAVRFLIAALLILVAAYYLYEQNWVGTPREWIALFFWGFALDVGIDTVVSVGGKVKPA